MQFPIRYLTKALIPPLDATPLVQVLGLLCHAPPPTHRMPNREGLLRHAARAKRW